MITGNSLTNERIARRLLGLAQLLAHRGDADGTSLTDAEAFLLTTELTDAATALGVGRE